MQTGAGTTGTEQRGKGKHGGARSSRDRLSYELTRKHCEDLIAAARCAHDMGLPFNRWITIAWGRNGIAPRDNRNITGRFIKLASDWLRRQGRKLVWAWVQEASDTNGPHIHLLLHVPDDLAPLWRSKPEKWVNRLLGARGYRDTLDTQRLPTGANEASDPAAYQTLVMGKVHYMLKAAPAALERELDMVERGYKSWGRSCPIYGNRLAIWQGWQRNI